MKIFAMVFSLVLTAPVFAQIPADTVSELGIAIEQTPNSTFIIRKVDAGSPAFQAGLKENDMITSVKKDSTSESTPIANKPIQDVLGLLKGPNGSEVTLQFLRYPQKGFKKVTLVRSETSKQQ